MTIQVELDLRAPETHLVRVTQTFPASDEKTRVFRMAAWVPGSYKIRDFGRHVQDLEAFSGKTKLPASQTGKDAWTVEKTAGKTITLQFLVYCRELTVDTSHVTSDHAHVFPATVVLYDEASRNEPHQLRLKTPRGWTAWSGLHDNGKILTAENYDHLIDCPIEVGPAKDYTVTTFTVRNKRHELVLWKAPAGMDAKAITDKVKAIVEQTAHLFGGLPYKHYTFLGHVAKDHGGGLEHRNSTVLGIDPLHLLDGSKIQENFLPLVAHEFFHTWNVKRILPETFQPYDLQKEVYTDLLWLFEGFTTYYELPLLARAQVVDEEHQGKIWALMLKFYEMALGRKRRSVSECSRLTWSLLYQPHEHNINRNVSYYSKGLFVGLCLDAKLRELGVKDGLDVVMRYLWKTYGLTGKGVPEDGMPAIIQEATGHDVRRLLNGWVHGTSELPIDESLQFLGWGVKRENESKDNPVGLGVSFKPGTAKIERIAETMASWKVLQPEDEIVAHEGYQWDAKRFASWSKTAKAGDPTQLHVFREGRLIELQVPLSELAKTKVTVEVLKGNAAATRRRKAWGKPQST